MAEKLQQSEPATPSEHIASDAPVTGQPVTLEEALFVATSFQRDGRLDEAEEIYRQLLTAAPDRPEVLHHAGVLAQQRGEADRAVTLIERSLELNPDQADCYSNLGIIFKAQGQLDKAVDAYQRAIALKPTHANAYSNLGVLFKAQGKLDAAVSAYRQAIAIKPEHASAHSNLGVLLAAQGKAEEAEAEYRTAIRLHPEFGEAYHNLGLLLDSQKRTREAAECFCRVTTLEPQHPDARRLLALAHSTLGEVDKATEIYQQWLDEEPDNPVARHMLAACDGRDVPARASDAYVEKTFDAFADSFDAKLESLSYQAPKLVAAMVADAGMTAAKNLDVLDAGCGTGLCGPLVAPYARRLVGVDLSEQMLTQARTRDVYDEVVKDELTAYLTHATGMFDVIISADTLVYFGALEDVFSAAAGALRPGGALVFTVERDHRESGAAPSIPTGADAGPGYQIQAHGRYTHTEIYVTHALEKEGFSSDIVHAQLRTESGVPVEGLVVRALKPHVGPSGVIHG